MTRGLPRHACGVRYTRGMRKRSRMPADPSRLAKKIIDLATGQERDGSDAERRGRRGGLKGGKSRARKLTAAERSEIARIAAEARWKKSR